VPANVALALLLQQVAQQCRNMLTRVKRGALAG
jgi:hypothetical protein